MSYYVVDTVVLHYYELLSYTRKERPRGGGVAMEDPRDAEWIEWDGCNEKKLARHQISAGEVEQVWERGPTVLRNKKSGSGDFLLVGRTSGGRALVVVVAYDSRRRTIRPITGWDCPDSMAHYLD
jgi:uncharacterized DUF497 family protein